MEEEEDEGKGKESSRTEATEGNSSGVKRPREGSVIEDALDVEEELDSASSQKKPKTDK